MGVHARECVQDMYQQGALRHRQRVEEMMSYRAKLQADCHTRRLVWSLYMQKDWFSPCICSLICPHVCPCIVY